MSNSHWIGAAILGAALAWPQATIAQIPPHVPGSICVTQQFWEREAQDTAAAQRAAKAAAA